MSSKFAKLIDLTQIANVSAEQASWINGPSQPPPTTTTGGPSLESRITRADTSTTEAPQSPLPQFSSPPSTPQSSYTSSSSQPTLSSTPFSSPPDTAPPPSSSPIQPNQEELAAAAIATTAANAAVRREQILTQHIQHISLQREAAIKYWTEREIRWQEKKAYLQQQDEFERKSWLKYYCPCEKCHSFMDGVDPEWALRSTKEWAETHFVLMLGSKFGVGCVREHLMGH